MLSTKQVSRLISKFMCDCCTFADEKELDRKDFLHFVLAQLWEVSEKAPAMDISGAYTDKEIIKDFFQTAEAIFCAGTSETEREKALAVMEGTRTDGKKMTITIRYGGSEDD